ncbi:hypothetical protein EDB80DRAFT_569156, partial [Ilyonectria destructans]
WLLIAITASLIVARIYLRLKINRQQVVLSDVFICLAWCCSVMIASFDIAFAKIGVLHQNVSYALEGFDADLETMQHVLKLFWVSNFPFYAGFYLSKAAILAFYEQLFPVVLRKRRFMLWMTVAYVACAWLVTTSVILFHCWPIEANWSLAPTVACPTSGAYVVFQIGWALHFSGDILIFILPFLILYRLRLRPLVKISVYCTFVLGIINISFCLARFLILQLEVSTGAPSFTLVELWSSLDLNVALLIACLPPLRPYLRFIGQTSFLRRMYKNSTDDGTGEGGVQHSSQRGGQRCHGNKMGVVSLAHASPVHGIDDPWDGGSTGTSSNKGQRRHDTGSEIQLVHVVVDENR